MGFIFYDTETTGTSERYDQILQFAAIHADENLREMDSINLRCRIEPHVVPSPGAMMVTRIAPDDLVSPPLSHFEMIREMRSWLLARMPAIFVGHNSIAFDEGFLRHAFYRTLNPLYLTNTAGSTRADTMRIAQAAYMISPGAIEAPINERGNPAFRLGLLARANGIAFGDDQAHDALADVRATLALARLMRVRAPLIWAQMMATGSKAGANAVIAREAACIHAEVYFGRPTMRIMTAFAAMPKNDATWVGFDLTQDPAPYLDLEADALRAVMKMKGQRPLHLIRTNGQPILFPIAAAPLIVEQTGLNHIHLTERAMAVRSHDGFRRRLEAALADFYDEAEPARYVEEKIYDGFPSRSDERLRQQFEHSDWAARAGLCGQFEDDRLRELGQRLVLSEVPNLLAPGTRGALRRQLADRALSLDPDVPWNTLAKARQELEALRDRATLPPEQARLDDIAGYLESLEERLTSWLESDATAEA